MTKWLIDFWTLSVACAVRGRSINLHVASERHAPSSSMRDAFAQKAKQSPTRWWETVPWKLAGSSSLALGSDRELLLAPLAKSDQAYETRAEEHQCARQRYDCRNRSGVR